MRWRLVAPAFIASLLIAGCGNGGVQVTPPTPPALRNPSVNPPTLDFVGGDVVVSVQVEATRAIQDVRGEMTRIDTTGGSVRRFSLTAAGGGSYQATVPVPANPTSTGQAARYRISLVAVDADGLHSAPVSVEVLVAAPDAGVPPLP